MLLSIQKLWSRRTSAQIPQLKFEHFKYSKLSIKRQMSFFLRVFERFDRLTHVCFPASDHTYQLLFCSNTQISSHPGDECLESSKPSTDRAMFVSLPLSIHISFLLLKYLNLGLEFSNTQMDIPLIYVFSACESSKHLSGTLCSFLCF
jgi:hypothetical protein